MPFVVSHAMQPTVGSPTLSFAHSHPFLAVFIAVSALAQVDVAQSAPQTSALHLHYVTALAFVPSAGLVAVDILAHVHGISQLAPI